MLEPVIYPYLKNRRRRNEPSKKRYIVARNSGHVS
jgi:hypothetical protein